MIELLESFGGLCYEDTNSGFPTCAPSETKKNKTDNGQQERCWLKAANQARGEDDGSEIRRSPVDMVNMAHYLHGTKYIPGGFSRRISAPSTVS